VHFLGERFQFFLQISDNGLLLPGEPVQKGKLFE
jgi:hypothetical protein